MAITKIKPIKSTVAKAIKYICNPDKTEEGILIDSFSCSPETAAMEFALTSEQGHRSKDKGTLAYHMVQSFKPEEVSVEEAHRIGIEYANAVLKDNYEYVISTHIDHGHIHNHIIFNAVSYVNQRKYDDCNAARYYREKINDKICRAHNLSVIKKRSGVRGRGKYEYEQAQMGTSWKAKLKKAIDEYTEKAESFEEFLEMMQSSGYEIKQGKQLSFRGEGQERFTRSKRIGEMYTEENIKKRIIDKEYYQTENLEFSQERKAAPSKEIGKERSGKIYILLDIRKNIKAQKSVAYKNKLVLENINRMIDTANYLEKNGLNTNVELFERVKEVTEKYELLKKEIKTIEDKMHPLAEQIKFGKNYWKYKKVYEQSKKEAVDSPFWTDENMKKIILFENALRYMKNNNLSEKDFAIKKLIAQYNELKYERNQLYQEYVNVRNILKELNAVKENIEHILGRESDVKTAKNKNTKSEKNKNNKKENDVR